MEFLDQVQLLFFLFSALYYYLLLPAFLYYAAIKLIREWKSKGVQLKHKKR